MRKYQPAHGPKVDLDDPKTYYYLPNTTKELDNLMFAEIGKALVYMDYFKDRKKFFPKRKVKPEMVKVRDLFPNSKHHKNSDKEIDINNGGYDQRQRVYKLIQHFADNRRHNYDNIMWLKEQVFLFQDETENMC